MNPASADADPYGLAVAGRDNMRQLVSLRWLAVSGQLATVLLVSLAMGVALPLGLMLVVIALQVALNIASSIRLRHGPEVRNFEVLVSLVLDVAALTTLLYLSGGATNPFISLFLLQVVLGAVLLDERSSWLLVIATGGCFLFLVQEHRPLVLPHSDLLGRFDLYIAGTLLSFLIIAVLLVRFITRIARNIQAGDARLAALRQQAAEEDHIVRMGLLASGAAHELGTPLSSLSVILSDWAKMPALTRDPERVEEIGEMQSAVARCKSIVTGILLSAGEARGESAVVATLGGFLSNVVEEWREQNGGHDLQLVNRLETDVEIVSDVALKQVIWNVLDNARDASPDRVRFTARRDGAILVLEVRDGGAGFTPEMLGNIGRPYHSTKGRPGGGLGLFLVVNVMRKLGGSVEAYNASAGGAVVSLRLPFATLELPAREPIDD